MNTIEHFKSHLSTLGIYPTEEGVLEMWTGFGDKRQPTQLLVPIRRGDEQISLPIMLPNEEMILGTDDKSHIAYCPLSENPFLGQSEVYNRLLVWTQLRLASAMLNIIPALTKMAIDHDGKKKPTAPALEMLAGMPNIPKSKSAKRDLQNYLSKVILKAEEVLAANALIKLKSERVKEGFKGVNIVGPAQNDYLRAVRIMTHAFQKEGLFGVKPPRPNIARAAEDIFKTLLGTDGNSEIVVGVSGHPVAPYYFAYLHAYSYMANHLHNLIDILETNGYLEPGRIEQFHLDWYQSENDIYADYESELNINFEGNTGLAGRNKKDISNTSVQHSEPTQIELRKPEPVQEEVIEQAAEQKTDNGLAPGYVLHPLTQMPVREDLLPPQYAKQSRGQTKHIQPMDDSPYQNRTQNMNTQDTLNQLNRHMPNLGRKKPEAAPVTAQSTQQVRAPEPVQQQAAQPVARPKPKAEQSTMKPAVRPAQRPEPSPGKVAVRRAAEMPIHVVDCLGNPLFYINGAPYCLKPSELPDVKFVQAVLPNGQPEFSSDGSPVLEEYLGRVNHAQGYPQGGQPQYNTNPATMTQAERMRMHSMNQRGYGQGQPAHHPSMGSARASAGARQQTIGHNLPYGRQQPHYPQQHHQQPYQREETVRDYYPSAGNL